jgi:dTDP-4-dehydrorhamnose reductase
MDAKPETSWPRLLVTGASGLLGLNLCLGLAKQNRDVVGIVNRNALRHPPFPVRTADLAQPGAAMVLLEQERPQVILHCAALANIDQAEAQPELAYRVNAELPGELATWAARNDAYLLHISTDAVFDGQRGDYDEDDLPNPQSVYARTKLQGEQAVRSANPQAGIARVNFYGWSLSGSRSLAEFFFNNLSAGRAANGFTDVLFRPLQVADLADLLLEMIAHRLSGVYHTLGEEVLSKYEFGCRLAQQFGFDPTLVRPISWREAGLKAARSPNLTLRVDRLRAALGHPLPNVDHGMQRFYEEHRSGFAAELRSLAG